VTYTSHSVMLCNQINDVTMGLTCSSDGENIKPSLILAVSDAEVTNVER
jgi:hypothetical protein